LNCIIKAKERCYWQGAEYLKGGNELRGLQGGGVLAGNAPGAGKKIEKKGTQIIQPTWSELGSCCQQGSKRKITRNEAIESSKFKGGAGRFETDGP